MSPQSEILIIAIVTSISCALPGTLLFLRRMSMTSDSITHTVLLGIVLAYLCTGGVASPLSFFSAALSGVATVWLTELLSRSRLLSEDSALGIVFPLLFSIAVILIRRHTASIHLDTDTVLLGELAFAPFERLIVGDIDLGAKAIYTSGAVLLLNLAFIALFYKELKLSAFDSVSAGLLGFAPTVLFYCLMAMVSITAVAAFQTAGSILVVAFMIAPAAAASFFSSSLLQHLLYSCLFSLLSCVLGFRIAFSLDVSIAGCIATAAGIYFWAAMKACGKAGNAPVI